jgi:hypothetical protein
MQAVRTGMSQSEWMKEGGQYACCLDESGEDGYFAESKALVRIRFGTFCGVQGSDMHGGLS